MQLTEILNLKFKGANNRLSLLDVYSPEKVETMPLIIFAHGFKGFKDWGHFPLLFQKLAKAGFVTIAFNFTHNGGTVDEPIDFSDLEAFSQNTYSKEQEDLEAILNWAEKDELKVLSKWNRKDIYLIGHSRGGSMAILKSFQDRRIKKVVSWAAVANLHSRLPSKQDTKKWKEEGVRWIKNGRTQQRMPMKYSFVEDLEENQTRLDVEVANQMLKIPQLIIHAKDDEAVSVEHAFLLKQKNQKAQLKILDKGGHTFGGKHPWQTHDLGESAQQLLENTIQFLKA